MNYSLSRKIVVIKIVTFLCRTRITSQNTYIEYRFSILFLFLFLEKQDSIEYFESEICWNNYLVQNFCLLGYVLRVSK